MTNEIVQYQQHDIFLPVMNLAIAIQRRDQLVGFVKQIMRADHDYGKIPGTDKNVLLKPGAEKLCTFFGLTPVFIATSTIQDWNGDEHGGEPLFYYRYKCELYRIGTMIATGEGSCSSRESKYRYRKGERLCPQCGQPAIIKGQEQYGGGWLCYKKKNGCGSKFGEKDPAIINQEVGRVLNPDVADLDNTILKMSQKRALIQAVLLGVNASEFFTQDMEDFVDAEVIDVSPQRTPTPVQRHADATPTPASNGITHTEPTIDIPADVAEFISNLLVDMKAPPELWAWAAENHYTENEHSARTRWTVLVKEHGGYTPAKFQAIATAYIAHYLTKAAAEPVAA